MYATKPLQILSVVFALSVLTAYVVYSQLRQTRNEAPSSKVTAIMTGNEQVAAAGKSNSVSDRMPVILAPGSKSDVQILVFWPDSLSSGASGTDMQSLVFAPGSKSAQVFDLSHLRQVEKVVRSTPFANTAQATNVAAPVKR